ncbi:OapC/ArvC family zinc-ribbon domain-containing protein [Halorubrum saccharovorum]|nr:Zn-ribbon containing protein [Halorubrum saccharovorum]
MPHQCTTCGRTFPDGSKEMLSGCPDCGGNKFQFKPAGETSDGQPSPVGEKPSDTDRQSPDADRQSPDADRQSPDADRQPAPIDDGAPDEGDASAADTRDPDSRRPDPKSSGNQTPDARNADSEHVRDRSEEDVAQASARSDVVSPDELDRASRDVEGDSSSTGSGPDASDDPEGPRPDIDDLRDELNEQFESIRIVSPGKYELNLMELYDRQEYIISLQEDGRYVIEMPDAWGISDE